MKKYFLALIFCLSCITANAAVINHLYTAEITVANRAVSAWQQAAATALDQVLVKVSGNPEINQALHLNLSPDAIKAMVLSYQYNIQETTPALTTPLSLQIKFAPTAINNLLTSHQQNVWVSNRPLTLIWLSVNSNQQQTILSSSSQNPVALAITKLANAKGLPVLLPMMDLTDMQAINNNSFFVIDPKLFQAASLRYHPNAILIGKLLQASDGSWQGQWQLVWHDQVTSWQFQASDVKAALTPVLNNLLSLLSAHAALADAAASDLTIEISNVSDMNRFAEVLAYLKNLNGVEAVHLESVGPQGMVLEVKMAGGVDAFNAVIRREAKLQLENNPTSDQTQAATLRYTWQVNVNANAASASSTHP